MTSTNVLLKAQEAFEGMAEDSDMKDEQDSVKLAKEIRKKEESNKP